MFDQITDFLKNGITTTVGLVVSIFGSADSQVANISQVLEDPVPIVEELSTTDEINFDNTQTATQDKTEIDSSLLLGTDLDKFDVNLKITEVKENEESYFVTYQYKTFFIENNIWEIFTKEDNLSIYKKMVAGKNLENYISEKLQEIAKNELLYLKEIKVILRKKILDKQTKTSNTYRDFVGKKIEIVEPNNYNQIIILEDPIEKLTKTNNTTNLGIVDNEAPLIVIQGNNPALIQRGTNYNDLGAKVTDNISNNLRVVIGGDVVNTEIENSYFVTYTSTDETGNVATATREVIVYDYGIIPIVEKTPKPIIREVTKEVSLIQTIPVSLISKEIPVMEEVVEETPEPVVEEVVEEEIIKIEITEEPSLIETIPESPVIEEVVEETPVVVSLLNFLGNARSSLQANIYNTQEKTSGSIKSIITPISSFVNKSINSLFSWF
jgi:hypothetical protein